MSQSEIAVMTITHRCASDIGISRYLEALVYCPKIAYTRKEIDFYEIRKNTEKFTSKT